VWTTAAMYVVVAFRSLDFNGFWLHGFTTIQLNLAEWLRQNRA
jgi:hypothetical protein